MNESYQNVTLPFLPRLLPRPVEEFEAPDVAARDGDGTRGTERRSLQKALSRLFNTLERRRPEGGRLDCFISDVFTLLRIQLGTPAMLVYVERREGFERHTCLGRPLGAPEALPPDCASLTLIERHRVYIFPDSHEQSAPLASGILSCGPTAGLVVGRRPHRYAFFLQLDEGWIRDRVDSLLNVVRAALGLQLLEERVRQSYRQVTELQASLIREAPRKLAGFEIACRSVPAEEIGGDFYDFARVSEDVVGLAIGDASGHGLPAALLVRDVVTALRMGLDKELRIEHVFGRLNSVIHRSNLSSRFVCLFYGELESNGYLHYVNAGHQPPLLFRGDEVLELRTGGTVIGPLPGVDYRRGFVRLEPDDTLVLFTDGLSDRRKGDGEFFGEERLRQVVRANPDATAPELLQRILHAAFAFGGGRPWDDDVTVMVVSRRPS